MVVRPTRNRASGAVGSAREWHSRGHRFDPGLVHQPSLSIAGGGCPTVARKRRRWACLCHHESFGWQAMRAAATGPFANPDRILPTAFAETANAAALVVQFQRIFRFQPSASALPSVSYAGRQEIRLRSQERRSEAALLRRSDTATSTPASPTTTPAAALTRRAYRPWHLHVTIELPDEQRAIDFERYLKSGSGRAFAKRHFG